jgi:uncharacterized heparinase superfamily protein
MQYVKDVCIIKSFYEIDVSAKANIGEGDEICNQCFNTVSGIKISFDGKVDWDLAGRSYRLVCFKLNSFQWLLKLSDAYKASGDKKYLKKGFDLIEEWQQANGNLIIGDKWNPYVIAERLMNWIAFVSCYAGMIGYDIFKYAGWISSQAEELSSSIEFQLGANHLLSEGRALMYAGTFLKDDHMYSKGRKILFYEFKIQFLGDGGHYERSISYHVESLQQYFEAVYLMQYVGDRLAKDMAMNLIKPYQFLNEMIGLDGKIPLVNDSAYDYPFDAADFLYTAKLLYGNKPSHAVEGCYSKRWAQLKSLGCVINWDEMNCCLFKETGYFIDRFKVNGKEYGLLLDVGDNGPDSNLGHAHADALSILWTAEDKRILVDSGVFTYEPGEKRNACRSTKAHNTIEVDGKNSAEIWSAFRVAKRGHTTILDCKDTEKEIVITASHDGYCHCLKDPVLHNRSLIRLKSEGVFIIKDELIGKKEKHDGVLRYHFNRLCAVKKVGEHTAVIDDRYLFFCSAPIKIEKCKIAEEFGMIYSSVCIQVKFEINKKSIVYSAFSFDLENGTEYVKQCCKKFEKN